MRLENSELNWIQRNFRYAAINFKEEIPELITAHIVDVWRKGTYEITAYAVIDGKAYRMDLEISYEGLESAEGLEKTIVLLVSTEIELFKEKNK